MLVMHPHMTQNMGLNFDQSIEASDFEILLFQRCMTHESAKNLAYVAVISDAGHMQSMRERDSGAVQHILLTGQRLSLYV